MSLRFYNTLTRSLEEFAPLAPPNVGIYVCGPTVYDDPHIGHARSAYIFDVLRRYLAHRGYDVTLVRNVTDVDDKIIEKARQELETGRQPAAGGTPVADPPSAGTPARSGAGDLKAKCREVAARYLKSYHETLDRLGIAAPDREPKATEHVLPDSKNVEATEKIDASMTGFISQLITKNMAYPAEGDVYFSVRKCQQYGALSNRSLDELKAGTRVEPGEHKADPLDFALWKAAKPDEPSWNSPWGPGRPGWHIECSVMSTTYLGDAFDIHGGGVDLVFPHHENEMAQAHALGKPFAKYWMHNGLLTVNGEKMSKSLGNFITLDKALVDCDSEPDVLKVFFLSSHYRSPVDYGSQQVEQAHRRWFLLKLLVQDGHTHQETWEKTWRPRFPALTLPKQQSDQIEKISDEFIEAMNDDLNTPRALACLEKLVNLTDAWSETCETKDVMPQNIDPIYRTSDSRALHSLSVFEAAKKLRELADALGLFQGELLELSLEQSKKIQERENARRRGDYQRADQIRQGLLQENIELRDTPYGTLWSPRRKR